jgi:hypothetical protein
VLLAGIPWGWCAASHAKGLHVGTTWPGTKAGVRAHATHVETLKPEARLVGLDQSCTVGVLLAIPGYAVITQLLQPRTYTTIKSDNDKTGTYDGSDRGQ